MLSVYELARAAHLLAHFICEYFGNGKTFTRFFFRQCNETNTALTRRPVNFWPPCMSDTHPLVYMGKPSACTVPLNAVTRYGLDYLELWGKKAWNGVVGIIPMGTDFDLSDSFRTTTWYYQQCCHNNREHFLRLGRRNPPDSTNILQYVLNLSISI